MQAASKFDMDVDDFYALNRYECIYVDIWRNSRHWITSHVPIEYISCLHRFATEINSTN